MGRKAINSQDSRIYGGILRYKF